VLLRFLFDGRFVVAAELTGNRDRARFIQLNESAVMLWLPQAGERLRCDVCSKPLSGGFRGAPCPRCHGVAASWPAEEVERHRTVRRILDQRSLPLCANEHTAQIPANRRVDIENQFKAAQSEAPLNVLACSPTLEMGIDVGGLDAVVLRNMPPRPDNYAQRGGRAGRRTRTGLVVGYARSTPHDQYFYDHPEEMISGEIPAPALSLSNRDVLLRHLHAIAFGAADPGLAGRMVEYVSPDGQIRTEQVNALKEAVRAQTSHALDLAQSAWGPALLADCGFDAQGLRAELDSLPDRIQNVIDRTARQVIELRQALDRYAASLLGRQAGTRAGDLVARLLGLPSGRRGQRDEAEDTSAGYPLRRFAEFGILPGYEFPSEPAALRLMGDPNEEDAVVVGRRFGIYQFMPEAPVYARANRWKVIGLDTASPWNPQTDAPWTYRQCRRCGLRYDNSDPRCPRCRHDEPGQVYPAHEFGGFLAQRNEAPVLEEEDRIAQRNLVACFPQWNGQTTERWVVGPGWPAVLQRGEEVRWLNEGIEPTADELQAGAILHAEAAGFKLCPVCGRRLTVPPADDQRRGRRQARNPGRAANADPFGHGRECPNAGQPPRPCAIVTAQRVETLRLRVTLPSGMEDQEVAVWGQSLGAALRIGMRQLYLLDGSELEFVLEGPWNERHELGDYRKACLTFIDPSVGGSGYMGRIVRELNLVARRALTHLEHSNCDSACYRCLKSYQNQRFHALLNWPRVVPDLDQLAEAIPGQQPHEVGDHDDPRPWLEAYAAGVGSPLELKFLRLFEQHGFHPQRQVAVSPMVGTPPISIADFAVPERRLAIYIDGAAFHVGANLRRDRQIRERLRTGNPPWTVVSLTARDLGRAHEWMGEGWIQDRDR
jgi:hypothetical protein